MKIECKFFATLRLELREDGYDIRSQKESLTIYEILQILNEKFQKRILPKVLESDNTIKRGTIILLNGKNVLHLEKLDTTVLDNDKVVIFPPAGGG